MPKGAKIAFYCACGDAAVGVIKPADHAAKFKATWLAMHSGIGCEPCSAEEASLARRHRERRGHHEHERTVA